MRAFLLYSVFERKRPVITFGQGNGAWNVARDSLENDSTIVSVGVGHDISFDLDLHRRYGCRILLLDPTPTGAETIGIHTPLPNGMDFFALGLADKDGDIPFALPYAPTEGSFRISGADACPAQCAFSCVRLQTFVQIQKLGRIDLLKMDIEGFEYGVIRDICSTRCLPRQICVEFHHDLVPGISRLHTLAAMLRLRMAGYQLINHDGLNHTFMRIPRGS